jgi:hypothetical protein
MTTYRVMSTYEDDTIPTINGNEDQQHRQISHEKSFLNLYVDSWNANYLNLSLKLLKSFYKFYVKLMRAVDQKACTLIFMNYILPSMNSSMRKSPSPFLSLYRMPPSLYIPSIIGKFWYIHLYVCACAWILWCRALKSVSLFEINNTKRVGKDNSASLIDIISYDWCTSTLYTDYSILFYSIRLDSIDCWKARVETSRLFHLFVKR